MGRKKIDKTSVEYLSKHLLHKDDIVGFQFTAGNTPLGVKENRQMVMSASLNKSRDSSCVIDCSEWELREAIEREIFGVKNRYDKYPVDLTKIKDFAQQFRDLGYEYDHAKVTGVWYWFRVKCKYDEIPFHVQRLKENLKLG